MKPEEKVDLFANELDYIDNDMIRNVTIELIKDIPDYFFEIPASSTGKYHPQYACGPAGLFRHTAAAAYFAHELKDANIFHLSNDDFDIAVAALILHDSCKCGVDDDHQSKFTLFDHPLLAADKIKNKFIESPEVTNDDELKQYRAITDRIAFAIESHMGRWNTAKYSSVVLPTPGMQPLRQFVHLCDYLASRKGIIPTIFNI